MGINSKGLFLGMVYSREIFSAGEVVFQGVREVNAYNQRLPLIPKMCICISAKNVPFLRSFVGKNKFFFT